MLAFLSMCDDYLVTFWQKKFLKTLCRYRLKKLSDNLTPLVVTYLGLRQETSTSHTMLLENENCITQLNLILTLSTSKDDFIFDNGNTIIS